VTDAELDEMEELLRGEGPWFVEVPADKLGKLISETRRARQALDTAEHNQRSAVAALDATRDALEVPVGVDIVDHARALVARVRDLCTRGHHDVGKCDCGRDLHASVECSVCDNDE
jgi:hypothetical protein